MKARASVLAYGGASPGVRAGVIATAERAGLLLRVETDDGIVAQGEASPLPGYSPDTLGDARRELEAIDWHAVPEPGLRGDARELLGRLERLSAPRSPAARFALETALLDVLGQRCGRALWELLGGDGAAPPVPLSVYVGASGDPGLVARAREAALRGARCIKVKIGRHAREELPVLEAVRGAIGHMPLRLDANQSLDPASARETLARLAAVSPEWVEEPVPSAALASLGPSPVPLALDESLQEPVRWESLPSDVIAVVLKPATLGGFSACLDLAARASTSHLVTCLSHTFDGPVALAAAAQLALAVGSREHGSGLAPHPGLSAWPPVEIPFIGETDVTRPRAPGLGIARLEGPR